MKFRQTRYLISLLSGLFSVLFIHPIQADASPSAMSNPLGKDRILALCLSNNFKHDSLGYRSFLSELNWDEFKERDLVFIEVQKGSIYSVSNSPHSFVGDQAGLKKRKLESRFDRLISRMGCRNSFEVVLIGKDSYAKKRWDNYPSFADVFATIDAMPMRQQEMRQQEMREKR